MSNTDKKSIHLSNKDLYFLNDIRSDVKKLKTFKKSNLYQIYSRINQLNSKITVVNDKINQLSDKINILRKEITKQIDFLQSKLRKFYKKLTISLGILSIIATILIVLLWLL